MFKITGTKSSAIHFKTPYNGLYTGTQKYVL